MAVASTRTMIPLDRVAQVLQIDPWHFHGIYTLQHPIQNACDDVWFKHDWQQSGKVSHETMAEALRQAEDFTASYLNWFPVAQWIAEEVPLPQHHRTELVNFGNSRAMHKSVGAKHGYVIETGIQAKTLIRAAAVVSLLDVDGDTFFETAEIVVATTVTNPEEIRIYYPAKNGRDEWEIRTITNITIAGGIATIRFPKYLIVKEELIEKSIDPLAGNVSVNGDDDTNFLQTVDVYRVYTDPSTQITFHAEDTEGCSGDDCEHVDETGCLLIRNSRLGILAYHRANWNATTLSFDNAYFTTIPLKATIYYRSGWQDSNQIFPTRQMDTTWERLIVYYAMTLLDQEVCGCPNTANIWNHQTEDLALRKPEQSFTLPYSLLLNPLGTTRAAMNLWRRINSPRGKLTQVPVNV